MMYDCRCISSKTARDCGKTRHDDCIGLPISSVLVSGFINNEINREPFISAGQHSPASAELARQWNVTLITQHADDTKWRSCLFSFSLFFLSFFFYICDKRARISFETANHKTRILIKRSYVSRVLEKKNFKNIFSPEILRVYTVGINRGFYWGIIQIRFRTFLFFFFHLENWLAERNAE